MCRNDTVCHRSVYFKLTRNRKGKRLGTPLATEPLGKTKKPKRSFLKTRCRGLIVSRQRNDFNVKAINRPDDLRAPHGNRLEAARLATRRASATHCAALGARTKDCACRAPIPETVTSTSASTARTSWSWSPGPTTSSPMAPSLASCWPGFAPKRYGLKAANSSWVVRSRSSCGRWGSAATAVGSGEN